MLNERAFFDWLVSRGKSLAVASKTSAYLAAIDKTGTDIYSPSALNAWIMTLKAPSTRSEYGRAIGLWNEYRAVYSGDGSGVPLVPITPIAQNRPEETRSTPKSSVEPSAPAARPVAAIPPAFGAIPDVPAQVIAPQPVAPPVKTPTTRLDPDEKPLPPEFIEYIGSRYAEQTANIYKRNIRRILAMDVDEDATSLDVALDAMQPGTRRAYLAAWRVWLGWRATLTEIPPEGVWLMQRLVEAGTTVSQLIALKRCHVGHRWIDDPTSDKPSAKLGVDVGTGHGRKAIDTLFALPGDEDSPLFGVLLNPDLIRKLLKDDVPDPALPVADEAAAAALDDPTDKAEALGWFVPVPDDALPGESSFDYLLRTGNDPHAMTTLPPEPE